METQVFSAEDELFLFETFMKLSNRNWSEDTDVFVSDDENDVPLSHFFLYEKDASECQSPTETVSSLGSPNHFFQQDFAIKRSPSPCESPASLFPPTHLEHAFFPDNSSLSISITTPPPTPLQQQSPVYNPPESDPVEYIVEHNYPPPTTDADSARIHFIDLKDLYEKAQVRRRGTSAQRVVNCRIHMVANFLNAPCDIHVCVQRFAETKDTVQLPVTVEKTMPNMQYFSVNLDSVYMTAMGKKFYQLSTTDRFRKNRFMILVSLIFGDNSEAKFKSEPFLIRSRKQSPNPRKPRTYSD